MVMHSSIEALYSNEHLQTGFWVKTCLLISPDTCSNPELKKSIDQVKERYVFSVQALDGCLLLFMFGLSHLSRSCMLGECCRTQGVTEGLARASEVARDATAQLKQQTTQVTVQQMYPAFSSVALIFVYSFKQTSMFMCM